MITNVPPADYGRRAEIYDVVQFGWFVCQMRRTLNGQIKSVAHGLYRYALRDGRGLPVMRMAHLTSGSLEFYHGGTSAAILHGQALLF